MNEISSENVKNTEEITLEVSQLSDLQRKYDKLKLENIALRGLVSERLPENVPKLPVANWDDYLDSWEDRIRAILGRNKDAY